MEKEITLSSFPVRDVKGNRPGDFTTKFSPEIDLSDKNASYYLAFNRIISMAFSWSNINSGYNNQKPLQILISPRESGIMKILILILRKRPKQLMEMEKKFFQLI